MISHIRCFTRTAGNAGLMSEVCHLGNHWTSLNPSSHIYVPRIIINTFRAVIKAEEVIVGHLKLHYLCLKQPPSPCQIPVATSAFPPCFSSLCFPFHSLLISTFVEGSVVNQSATHDKDKGA